MTEAVGKILGMAMAYGVSSLGLLLAYVNYRRRVVKAEKVISSRAWAVIAVSLLAVAGGSAIVASLAAQSDSAAARPAAPPAASQELQTPAPPPQGSPAAVPGPPSAGTRARWPWVGIAVPAAIFLIATWITAALHRRFTHSGHGPPG